MLQVNDFSSFQSDSHDIGSSIFTGLRSLSKFPKTDGGLETWTIDLSFLSTHSPTDIRIVTAEKGVDDHISIGSLYLILTT